MHILVYLGRSRNLEVTQAVGVFLSSILAPQSGRPIAERRPVPALCTGRAKARVRKMYSRRIQLYSSVHSTAVPVMSER